MFKGDLWFFPAGLPHSLPGMGPVGAEFAHLNIPEETLAKFPRGAQGTVPLK